MPDGVMYNYDGEVRTVYFANPQAVLAVKLADGQMKLVPWGRRKTQNGCLPMGGWARLPTIYQGKWNTHMPKPVRLPILKFMEKDFEGNTHWYDVTAGFWIQGLLARESDEVRVYIVTITPELHTTCHDRWPRIITSVVD
jgi:hypothetical protein